ncbi:MAG: uracil-DNA glycosylase [Candidatus Binataceae bacterium]
MNAQVFVANLSRLSLPSVFNPYRDVCSEHDGIEGPAIRRSNLRLYLDAALRSGVDSVWLGRDCGYRGARRTGIALTDEAHLTLLARRFAIEGIAKATNGPTVKERTATEVWKIIHEVDARMFLWNIFPFHPFESGDSMTNRRHTVSEFNQCKQALVDLLDFLKPRRIIALGADAQKALARLGISASGVRHPSYGGQADFAAAIRKLYV